VTRTRKRLLGLLVIAVAALVIASLPWLRSCEPGSGVSDAPPPGFDEIVQIAGVRPRSAEASGVPGSGAGSTDAAAPSLRGQVVRPGGEPAAGARVVATCVDDSSVVDGFADAGGLFDLPAPDCLYAVEATHESFGPAIVAGVRPGPVLRLVLSAGVELRGVVSGPGGIPLAQGTVHVGGPGLFPQRVVPVLPDGRYAVPGLRPGRYEIVAIGPGFGSGFALPATVDVDTRAPVAVDIPVRPAPSLQIELVDRATDEDVPWAVVGIAGAALHVVGLHEVVVGGALLVDYLPPGQYVLRVRAPGFLPRVQPIRVSTDDEQTVRIELSRGARVAGTVRDLAGNPVAGARLTAFVETPAAGRWEMRRNLFEDFHRLVRPDGAPFWALDTGFVTDAQGRYALSGLPSGVATLVASRTPYAPAYSAPLLVQADAVYENVDLVLEAGRRVRGRVVDAGGGGVPDAWVSAAPAGQPIWALGDAVVTDPVGMFLLDHVGARVTVSVRHADFGPATLSLDVPEDGLDDVIIRLSGQQRASFGGRVFAVGGQPAVGARVWVMHGQSDIPVCRATVGWDGFFEATDCSAAPERILVAHHDHAVLRAEVGGAVEPRDWQLTRGGEIEIVTQRLPVSAQIEPALAIPTGLWTPPDFELDRWVRQRVERLSPGAWRVHCRADGYQDAVVEVTVTEGGRAEALCPFMFQRTAMELRVVDSLGAPVSGALVFVDDEGAEVRALTDEIGAVRWDAEPGRWRAARAVHERWGEGRLDFFVPWSAPDPAPRIELSDPVGGADRDAFRAMLAAWGVDTAIDGRATVVDRARPDTPTGAIGLRRGDLLLWAHESTPFRLSLGVRRGAELLVFEAVRPASTAESP
jgi:hypothetical protein